MDDIQRAIEEAWKKVGPMLESDPAELRRRVLRRTNSYLKRPPRAWCLGVRANDTRLWPYATKWPDREHRNEVMLDPKSLYELCSLVYLRPPGETIEQVMEKLGVANRAGLLPMRAKGFFGGHHVKSSKGYPTPLLYAAGPLDPQMVRFAPPDPAWSFTAEEIAYRIPEGIEATLTRVPVYRGLGRDQFADGLHPEHPALVGGGRKFYSRKAPAAKPDYVWYKWKGDEFIGYDWRAAEKNPRIRENYESRQRKLERIRKWQREYRTRKWPKDRVGSDSLVYWGWRWLCPKCERKVKELYCPLSTPTLLAGMLDRLEEIAGMNLSYLDYEQTFGCKYCHRISPWSRMLDNAWNKVVGYLSGGLLLGKEVERPEWFTRDRKYEYSQRLNCAPSVRRPQVEELLLEGLNYQKIGVKLGIRYEAAKQYAQLIYRQHGVRGREQFMKKHGKAYIATARKASTRRPQVEEMLRRGMSYREMAEELGITYGTVNEYGRMVCREHGVRTRREFLKKYAKAYNAAPQFRRSIDGPNGDEEKSDQERRAGIRRGAAGADQE